MPLTRPLLVSFAPSFALAGVLLASPAAAQSIVVINETSLPRLDKNHVPIQKRPLTLTPEAINLQDCVDDQLIRFTLQMSGFEANAVIQAWASIAGQDCKAPTARAGGQQICWKVLDSDIPLITTTDVDIPVKKLISGAPPAQPTQPDPEPCGKVNLANITVHFLYFKPGDLATSAVDKTIGIQADTVGPKPPTGLRALPGNGRITVSWANISGGSGDAGATGGLTELTGVNVYCDPGGAAGGTSETTTPNPPVCRDVTIDGSIDETGDATTDGSTTVQVCEDGGSTTSTTTTSGCGSTNFDQADGGPLFPTAEFDAKFKCGGITGNTGTTAIATGIGDKPLQNNTNYAVAVAATDKFGNVGEVSDVVCQTPEVTTDFWDDYRKAGGKAGGGCDSTGTPLGGVGVLLLAVGSTVISRMRAKKRDGR